MLTDQIKKDLKEALKSGDNVRLSTLRLLSAAFHNQQIALIKKEKELTDEEALRVIHSEVKKRRDSVMAYQKGRRQDLADQEKSELAILEKYQPAQLPEEEIIKIVKEIVAKNPDFQSPSAFGKVMGQAMAKLKGRADGNIVQSVVKNILNSSK